MWSAIEDPLLFKGEEEMVPQLSVEEFVYILQHYRKAKDPLHILRLLCQIHKCGLKTHSLLGNQLVMILVEAGSMDEAQQVFDTLVHRDERSWTALITRYVRYGKLQHAFTMYKEMQEEDSGVAPGRHILTSLLRACSKMKDLEWGLELHSRIEELGLGQGDAFIGSTLIDMYAKCGSLLKAQEVFSKLLVKNVVCWNALISAYADHGHGKKALMLFEQMQLEGACIDAVTLICCLKACASVKATVKGQEIHSEFVRLGLLERDIKVGNALVDMYAKCRLPFMAQEVFESLQLRDVVSWTALIAGYAEHGHGAKALKCFELMRLSGIQPNAITLVCIVKACGSIGDKGKAEELYTEIQGGDLLETNPMVGNALIDTYVKCDLLEIAKKIFNKIPVRDVVSWTSLIAGYADHGYGDEALNLFREMELNAVCADATTLICMLKACGNTKTLNKGQELHAKIEQQGFIEGDLVVGNTLVDMYAKCGGLVRSKQVFDRLPVRDLVAWNALMSGYAELGHGEEVINCLERMQLQGVSPDAVSFVCSLKACGIIGAKAKGQKVHVEIVRREMLEKDQLIGSTLVDMYARCGSPARAQEVLDKLLVRNVVTWTSLMDGYGQLGESQCVFIAFERMLAEQIKPDSVTFIVILSTCSQKGLVSKISTYFEAMSNNFGIVPAAEHHICVLNVLVRAGHVERAVKTVKKFLPLSLNLVAWRTVLSACHKWGDLESARHAFEHTVHLDLG